MIAGAITRQTTLVALASPLVILAVLLAFLSYAFYNVYLHPLRTYPGPKLWAATRFFWIYYRVTGQLVWKSVELHRKYGSVVRVAPDHLSYTTETAWKTIYGNRSVELQKNVLAGFSRPGVNVHSILSADRANHTRLRRILAPAFSEKAVKEQDNCVMKYVNLLIQKLAARSVEGPVDMNQYFTWTTIDLISDMMFGQPEGALEREKGGSWVDYLIGAIQSQVWLQALDSYSLGQWRKYFLPKAKANAVADNFRITSTKIDNRLSNSTDDRKDVFSYILPPDDEKGMSLMEMKLNSAVIIGAGTGTTTTWLSTNVHNLTCNPDAYQKLSSEIRHTFANANEITSESVTQLPYLAAVLQESLRMHSPSPSSLGRFVPKGGDAIDGRFVPAGTTVGVHQHAAYHLASNFYRPDDFCPERWLPSARDEKSPFASDRLGVVHPFSYGPRTCLGIKLTHAETRIIIAKLFWHFDLELLPEYKDWQTSQKGTVAWHRTPLKCRLTLIRRN
ncbi:hypothetical protein JMJ35_010726 [Cladonia borealis]|uniref:Cytochrome P450 n=1 Tax=Cladonia borealis TaxID=184061 RepID=A0AA39QPR6_9LECA|nr:hypothetical protein JMJ35_010726 [Cladonia borealis]